MGCALWLRFENQVSRRLLSTTNSKLVEFRFSLNWLHKPARFALRNKTGTFCGQGFFGFWPLRKNGFCGQEQKTGRFCNQELFGFVAFHKKTGVSWSVIFELGRFVARNILRRPFCGQDFFLRTRDLRVRFVEARSRPVETVASILLGPH